MRFQICDFARSVWGTGDSFSKNLRRRGTNNPRSGFSSTGKAVRAWKTPSAASDAGGVFSWLFRFIDVLFPSALEPPDLAIEMPDFQVAVVDELARGFQGLRVGIGLERPERRHAIVRIDQVNPIGRHDGLLPRDNAGGMQRGRRQPCGNRMEPALSIRSRKPDSNDCGFGDLSNLEYTRPVGE